ncbi:unnamed protein product [Heligmosomoides polygyrus]|uniref:beta-N-acetylhexosaminidase n=1 Tax=Heligmosomoides polygyrus TaxID=6339 RepID=A0A183GUL5_HELPZ|nr:unnamed protein product [Heligmosomoides polygyrus]
MDVPLKSEEHRRNVPIERPKAVSKKPPHLPINVNVAFNKTEIISLNKTQRSEKYHYENVIVHFDLKGAPPTVDYFLVLLRLVQQAGATGVLIEWEDMFPWSGKLESVKSTNAYTIAEVRKILQTAKNLELEVIPLVQTFGHMEWILKYEEFRKYRESDSFPQVICLGNPEAVALAEEAVKQVASIHREYDLKRFHIGADEAFQVFVFITEALKSYVYEKCEQNCILKIIVFGHLMVRIFYLFSFFWNL